jgi:hypothetical protein
MEEGIRFISGNSFNESARQEKSPGITFPVIFPIPLGSHGYKPGTVIQPHTRAGVTGPVFPHIYPVYP